MLSQYENSHAKKVKGSPDFPAGLKSSWNLKWQMQGCFSLKSQFDTEMGYFVPKFSVVQSQRLNLS